MPRLEIQEGGLPRAKRPRNDAKPVVSRPVIASESEAIQLFEIIMDSSVFLGGGIECFKT